jgi:hypothetical protein
MRSTLSGYQAGTAGDHPRLISSTGIPRIAGLTRITLIGIGRISDI